MLYDTFSNPLQVGGHKFHIRLIGDASFDGAHAVIPTCRDSNDGKYLCSYSALYTGPHELHIRLLNYSITQPGGLGMTGRYYIHPNSPRVDEYTSSPLIMRIDSHLSFSWPSGSFIPADYFHQYKDGERVSDSMPLLSAAANNAHMAGQYIRWDGYLVPPRSDEFRLKIVGDRINATIYVESVLVFDSHVVSGGGDGDGDGIGIGLIEYPVSLMDSSAYRVTVEVSIAPSEQSFPSSMKLLWSTPSNKWSIIPGYFLYDSADAISFSPFPVEVI
jgi:hypothetical protein